MRPIFQKFTILTALAVAGSVLIAPSATADVASAKPTDLVLDAAVASVADNCGAGDFATVEANWTAPNPAPSQYSVSIDHGTATQVSTTTSSELCLAVGTSVLVQVYPLGSPADVVEATIALTKTAAPNLNLTRADAGFVASWHLDGTTQYPAATEYRLEYKLATDSAWTTFTPGAADALKTTASVAGLSNDKEYQVRVASKNIFGWSDESATGSVTPGTGKQPQTDQNVGTDTPLAPVDLPKELGSWCTALAPAEKPGVTKRKAQQLMAGTIDFGKGGRYWIDAHPNWQPQSTADTSGNRHVNSLYWALPLLYRGVDKQKPALVNRFKELLYFWIDDHQSAASRTTWIKGSIYGGRRTQTLVCAAQTLNDEKLRTAALRDADQMLSSYWGGQSVALGTNNTDLIRQTAAFAAFCWVGDVTKRDTGWANTVAVARNIVYPDGSDVEGSPGYVEYIEELMNSLISAANVCGTTSDPIPSILTSVYEFMSFATRPDFNVESIGDTETDPVKATFGVSDARAEWLRTSGASGSTPSSTYATFDGGYAFGRGAWLSAHQRGNDSWYSLRYSSIRPSTPHTHDDGAAVTFYAKGVSWLGDPGPYRYDNNAPLRWYMLSRGAHSSFSATGVAHTKKAGVKLTSSTTTGDSDTTCVKDLTWSTMTITRCVTFTRSTNEFTVTDTVDAAKVKKVKGSKKNPLLPSREVTTRWQLPNGVSPARSATGLTLSKGTAALDVVSSSTARWKLQGAKASSSTAWFTGEWGEKIPGAVASQKLSIPRVGGSFTTTTTFMTK